MKPLIEAIELATQAHGEQTRKYSGRSYIEHPIRVMCKLYKYASAQQDEYLGWICMVGLPAAVCHDVLEDTTVTYKELSDRLGIGVANLVLELTNRDNTSLPRAERKRLDRERLSNVSSNAKLIKLLGRQDNLEDVVKFGGPVGWVSEYTEESRLLVDIIGSEYPRLRDDIMEIITLLEPAKNVYGEPPLKQCIGWLKSISKP